MEKQKFEKEWSDALDQAEVAPSESLWTAVELQLEKAEGDKMKRRLLFYKLTAAASVLLAMCVAGTGIYYYKQHQSLSAQVALNTVAHHFENKNGTSQMEITGGDSVSAFAGLDQPIKPLNASKKNLKTNIKHSDNRFSLARDAQRVVEQAQAAVISKIKKNYSNISDHNDTNVNMSSENNSGSIPLPEEGAEEDPRQLALTERKLPALVKAKNIVLKFPEIDPVALMMAKLERRERELMEKKTKKESSSQNERLWTSVGFAAGAFNASQNASQSSVNSFTSTPDQSHISGTSYSVGMNMGARLSGRWVLQGGVNYLTQNSAYQANAIVSNPGNFQLASNAPPSKQNHQMNNLVAATPYSVNNNLQFINVPLQAGYMIINHTLGLQINGGVSTDLFLQNTLSSQNSSLPNVTQGNGEESPYRAVNFSGLVGTEVSYRFSKHYRLALNPGLRYPFNSIYKSSIGVNVVPLTFDIGLRFRYIFH